MEFPSDNADTGTFFPGLFNAAYKTNTWHSAALPFHLALGSYPSEQALASQQQKLSHCQCSCNHVQSSFGCTIGKRPPPLLSWMNPNVKHLWILRFFEVIEKTINQQKRCNSICFIRFQKLLLLHDRRQPRYWQEHREVHLKLFPWCKKSRFLTSMTHASQPYWRIKSPFVFHYKFASINQSLVLLIQVTGLDV